MGSVPPFVFVDKPHYYDGKTYEILFDGALKMEQSGLFLLNKEIKFSLKRQREPLAQAAKFFG